MAAVQRQLKIKLGVCKRLQKEVVSYEKEASDNEAKVQKMRDEGKDAHDVRKQEEVLAESCMMIPDSKNRLKSALEELAVFVEANEDEEGFKEAGDLVEVRALLQGDVRAAASGTTIFQPLGRRLRHEFCWTNMLTHDVDAARQFFATLLHWTYGEIPGMGHTVLAGGHEIGAMFDLAHPNTPAGLPPHIGVMIKVDDAEAACGRVADLHGRTAKPPMTVNTGLRMAVCYDSTGAAFDLWESATACGIDVDSTVQGAPAWFELVTQDLAKATEFYSNLFNWTPNQLVGDSSGAAAYTTFTHCERLVAGMRAAASTGDKPYWSTAFTVQDAEEAARTAVSLGGSVHTPVHTLASAKFCVLKSPQGVQFSVVQH